MKQVINKIYNNSKFNIDMYINSNYPMKEKIVFSSVAAKIFELMDELDFALYEQCGNIIKEN